MKLNRKQRHSFLKCAEELNELSIELLHAVNKIDKNNWGKICDEISDVENWIAKLKEMKEC
jgi:NTP pyrophosphatase (non-canonical NTP hydrolase)